MQTKPPLTRVKYAKPEEEFCSVLKERVFGYFKEKGISRYANREMHIKTFVLLGIMYGSYALMLSNWFHSWDLVLIQCIFYLMSFIVWVGISHDAHHRAYTPNAKLNKVLIFIGDLMGVSSYMMDYNHVRAHHSAVNVPHHDVSIDSFGVMRFHPDVPHRWFHRFQPIYIVLLYGVATVFKLFAFDFFSLRRKQIGAIKIEKHPWKEIVYMVFMKALVIFYTLIIPILVIDAPLWIILTGFFVGHFVSGVFLSMIFQVTHLCDYSRMTSPDDDQRIHNEFPLHVMENTSSFSIHSKWMNWFSGGLNNHTIHHIFPGICQIHFPELTLILKETAKEYGIPFKEYPSIWAATQSHFRMLYKLSKPEPYQPEPFTEYPLNSRYAEMQKFSPSF